MWEATGLPPPGCGADCIKGPGRRDPRCRRCSPARQARRLTGGQAQELVESLDVSGMAGKRDKAVLLLLKRLGLRAVEVSRLDLEDIHWRQGTLRIHRKG
jgi:site-specific recombinase XerD